MPVFTHRFTCIRRFASDSFAIFRPGKSMALGSQKLRDTSKCYRAAMWFQALLLASAKPHVFTCQKWELPLSFPLLPRHVLQIRKILSEIKIAHGIWKTFILSQSSLWAVLTNELKSDPKKKEFWDTVLKEMQHHIPHRKQTGIRGNVFLSEH